MAIETDRSRLRMIKAVGGLIASFSRGDIWCIFDNGNADVLSMVESSGPSMHCRSSDVSSIAITKDDEVEINGEQYRVKKMDPDGTGMTMVHLKK